FPQIVRFQRPSPVNIYITVNITKEDLFPLNGEDAIKANIVAWAASYYKVGANVIASRIYTPANQVIGHKIDSILISKTPNPTSSDDLESDYIEIEHVNNINLQVNS